MSASAASALPQSKDGSLLGGGAGAGIGGDRDALARAVEAEGHGAVERVHRLAEARGFHELPGEGCGVYGFGLVRAAAGEGETMASARMSAAVRVSFILLSSNYCTVCVLR